MRMNPDGALLTSADGLTWTNSFNDTSNAVTTTTGRIQFSDSVIPEVGRRFYRVVEP